MLRVAIADALIAGSRRLAAAADRISPAMAITPGRSSPIIHRDLGVLGQAAADSGYLVLEAIASVQGERTAADAAAGYADAYARFALNHPDAFD